LCAAQRCLHTAGMDQLSNARWLETLKREKRAKEKWQGKYLTMEDQRSMHEEEQAAAAKLSQENSKNPNRPHGRLTERDASELRLKALDDGLAAQEEASRPVSSYEVMRRKVAEDVAASRPRSHRFTGDLTTGSMLRDIGPGLWSGMNPGYVPTHFSSSSHSVHAFTQKEGWGEKVDKEHHMKLDVMLQHADKCLQLGEKPFVSGGMKLSGGR